MPIVEKVKKNSDVYDIQDSRISDISSLATLTGVQTLSNKTLINPVIQTGSGANDKITVEGKINSSNGITLNADVKINKSIQIDPSEEGEFFVGISNTSANTHTNVYTNGITTFHPYQGWEMFTGINVDQGPHIRLTKDGIDKRLLIPNVDGTLATVGDVNTLASTVSSNYSNTVKKNDSGLQYITGGLSVAGGITSPNYKTASIVSGNTYSQIISGGMDHIDYSDNYYKPYLRFTTEGTFARGTVNPNISLGTYISNYNVYSFIRGLSPNQNSGEADYVEYKLPQVDSNEVTETTLLCAHDLQDRFYAPTTPGTTSQVLVGNPSGEPQWQNLSDVAGKGYTLHVFLEDSTGGNLEGSVSLSIYYANGSWDFVTLNIPEGGYDRRTFYHVSGYTLGQRSIRGMYDRIDGSCTGNRAKLSESTNQFGGAVSGDLITSAAGTSYLMLSDVSYTVHFETE